MHGEPGKGTQERSFVMWPSMAAVNPASTRHREINFQTCFLSPDHLRACLEEIMVKTSMHSHTSSSPVCVPTTVSSQIYTGGLA